MKKAVIFDFDGTIADTFLLAVDVFYHVTGRKEPLPKHLVSELRELSIAEVALRLGVPFWKLPYLMFRGRRLFAKRIDQAQAVPGMAQELKRLKRRHDLYIVSSNSPANVEYFLRKYKIDGYFSGIYGNARLKGKARILRRICRRGYDPSHTVYVGDETRDIEAAHHAGVKAVAVAWGYNNVRALNRHNPDKIVFEPAEIKRYLATIKK